MHEVETSRSPTTGIAWTLTGVCGEGQSVRKVTVGGTQLVVGRCDDADLLLDFRGVSKRHACLKVVEGQLFVHDLGSTNGTFVKGRRIAEETPLHSGDVVQFANAPFQVSSNQMAEACHTQAEMVVDRAMALMQFDRLMMQRTVTPHFQPIVTLGDATVVGFEVLARSRIAGLETAQDLFQAATLVQQEVELSRLFRDEGLRAGLSLSNAPELFLNTHPAELGDQRLVPSLNELRSQHPQTPITLEIHESAVTDPTEMSGLRSTLKQLNMKLAYDDFGAGQARLIELVEVPPEYLKFDRKLIQNIHTAPAQRQQMLQTLIRMVCDLGIVPLAEGVELAEEAEVCLQLGFQLGQGYLWGRPDGPATWNLSP